MRINCYEHNRVCAVIPARGGSKGIPRKNIKALFGKPLIAYSIEQALESKSIDDVYVSTEDVEIAAISSEYGAKIITRPEELASDTAKTMDVMKHAHLCVKANYYVLLQAVNPLRSASTINNAISQFVNSESEYDSLVAVKKCEMKLGSIIEGYYEPNYKGEITRQMLEEKYYECGVIYIYKASMMLKGDIYGDRIMPYMIKSDIEAIDIDNQEQFDIVEAIIRNRQNSNEGIRR